MSTESNYQVSHRIGDAIVLVRGNDAEELKANLLDASEDGFLVALDTFITAINTVSPVQVVKAAIPGSERVPQGGGDGDGGGARTCPHGTRTERSGNKASGGRWTAYFCPARVCKPQNPDGSEWK